MKTRAGYVSNSSSTSFILDGKHLADVFIEHGLERMELYPVDSVKTLLRNFLKEFHSYLVENKIDIHDEDSMDGEGRFPWDVLQELASDRLEGNVPHWIVSDYVYLAWQSDLKALEEQLSHMPDGKYITEGIDRDWIYNEFNGGCPDCDGIEVFDCEA